VPFLDLVLFLVFSIYFRGLAAAPERTVILSRDFVVSSYRYLSLFYLGKSQDLYQW
tara:strand:+ start:1864 stop:2031 length:168 start_codon:yes stop_codon:yes gene_type:complete